ncbi:DNA polymerase-4 [Nitrosomonas sp. PY1]|nr:DNA polymerase-4 [Nitrosomonas sp. PY1]
MDAFYVSIELIRYPQLRGLPVVVGGRTEQQPTTKSDGMLRVHRLHEYVGRGVITTATYEARVAGVFSGMSIMKAAQLVPNAVLLPANFADYRYYSKLFKAAVAKLTTQIEDSGIDEIYIDLTQSPHDSKTLGNLLKQTVKEATGLYCSIGIAPNKLLAKICSDLEKPDGLTIMEISDIPDRIWPLSVKKINGIGPKATKKLAVLGIYTIGELAQARLSFLKHYFGHSYAIWLAEAAQGIDDRPIITNPETKSISRETTFERDLDLYRDRATLTESLNNLCEKVAQDLKRKNYIGRTICIKLRFADFQTLTRNITLSTYTDDEIRILAATRECLRRIVIQKKIRLLGVRVSSLSPFHYENNASAIPLQAELPFDVI